jgi:hypothetical protein
VREALRAHTRLTVAKSGTGNGIVVSSPAGIDCGASCARSFRTGTTVTLSALDSPSGRSEFVGWSGCTASSGITCQVSLSSDRQVTATYRLVRSYSDCYNECLPECLEMGQPQSRCLPYCSNLCRNP